MSPSDKIIQLRSLIARQTAAPVARNARAETGLASVDEALDGGLWKGGMVELVGAARSSGSAALVRTLLKHFATQGRWSALIDGQDCFDPQLAGARVLSSLLWIRCREADQAMRSADLLLRDGNLPLVVLDLHGNPEAQLRKIASTTWYRLQRVIEPTAVALLVVTPRPLVPCADARLELHQSLPLSALEWNPGEVLCRSSLRVTRKRSASGFDGQAFAAEAG